MVVNSFGNLNSLSQMPKCFEIINNKLISYLIIFITFLSFTRNYLESLKKNFLPSHDGNKLIWRRKQDCSKREEKREEKSDEEEKSNEEENEWRWKWKKKVKEKKRWGGKFSITCRRCAYLCVYLYILHRLLPSSITIYWNPEYNHIHP